MDNKVLKRGRPKGAEQTVIGLPVPAKWKCFTKPVAFCKKDPLKKTESKKKHLVCCQPGIVYYLDYIVCKSNFYIVQYPVFKINQSSLHFTGRPV